MADDKYCIRSSDCDRGSLSEDELRDAVDAVGNHADKVGAYRKGK